MSSDKDISDKDIIVYFRGGDHKMEHQNFEMVELTYKDNAIMLTDPYQSWLIPYTSIKYVYITDYEEE